MKRRNWIAVILLAGLLSARAEDPVPKPDADGVYPNWLGVKPALLVKPVEASFKDDPRLAGMKHICSLLVVIGADSTPKSVEIVNSNKAPFDDAAVKAIQDSQFKAGTYNGEKVATRILVWVPFLFGTGRPAIPETVKDAKGLKHPIAIYTPEIELSPEAKAKHLSGMVLFQLVVMEDGHPSRIRQMRLFGYGMDEKAMETVSKYRFKPATLEGVPVPTMITVEVNFREY